MSVPSKPTVSHCHSLAPVRIPKVPKWERMSKGKDEWESGAGGGGRGRVPSLSRNHMAQPLPPQAQAVKIKGPTAAWLCTFLNLGSGLQGTSLSCLSPLAAH